MTRFLIYFFVSIFPLLLLGQTSKRSKPIDIVYNATITKKDAGTKKKRNAFVSTLQRIQKLAKEDTLRTKLDNHIAYLESLEYFDIPKANITLLSDEFLKAKNASLATENGQFFIEPNADFKNVIGNTKSGMYLYVYINSQVDMYLELVHYTSGEKMLSMDTATVTIGDETFKYYLNWVKSKENGFERCTIEANTKNFLQLFETIQSHSEMPVNLQFTGDHGSRTEVLPVAMVHEIANMYELYQTLKLKK